VDVDADDAKGQAVTMRRASETAEGNMSWSDHRAMPGASRGVVRRRGHKKRRPHEEGVKSLRQVSYRQETYRAV